jgi:hypothetical protein
MINFENGRLGLASAHVTDDNAVPFLSVGVQLLPVFWLVLAVETTWLRSKVRQAKTNRQQTVVAVILAGSFPVGAFAECLALLVLLGDIPAAVEPLAAGWLYLALAYSAIASAIAMYRAIMSAERETPPPSTNASPTT